MPTPRWPPRPTASPSGTRSSPPDRGVPSSPAPQGRERAAGMLKSRGCEARARVTATRPPAASRSPNSRGSAMPQLAKRMGRAKPSAIMVVAEKAKQLKAEGRDIISFSIGIPNFLPGDPVYDAARQALEHDSGQYGSTRPYNSMLDPLLQHLATVSQENQTASNHM